MTNPLPSLQSLIARVQGEVQAEKQLKAAETKTKTARTDAERAASQAEADAIRAIVDWIPRAIVLVIENVECACGEEWETPQGMFILKEHARMANSAQLIPPRSESQLPDLPRRIKYTNRICAVCQACMGRAGFSKILTDKVSIPGQVTIPAQSGLYVQEWLAKRAPTEE